MTGTIVALVASAFFIFVDTPVPENDCGVNCLFLAFHALNEKCEVSLDDLTKQLAPERRGNTLEELNTAALNAGFHSLPVKTSLESLRIRKRPFAFIAHVNPDHFILVSNVTATTVTLEEAPRSGQIPASIFLSNWDGTGLVISTQELETEEALSSELWWTLFASRTKKSLMILAAAGVVMASSQYGWRRWRGNR